MILRWILQRLVALLESYIPFALVHFKQHVTSFPVHAVIRAEDLFIGSSVSPLSH